MTMTVTFTGSAAEIREEMRVLLGETHTVSPVLQSFARNFDPDQSVEEQVTAAFGEVKRGRGRPRKEATEQKAEQESREEALTELKKEAQEKIAKIEEVAASVSAPAVVEVPAEPLTVKPEVKEEGTSVSSAPAPTNAQDLMSAAMELVKGDSAKKIALVKLLGSYGAKTINTLAPEHYAEFWEKVQGL